MKKLLNKKKGVSNLIAYIILISITISISVVAYNWLIIVAVPNPEVKCPETASISLRDVSCDASNHELSFKIKNNGFFNVHNITVYVNDREGSDIGVFKIIEKSYVSDPLEPDEIDDSAALQYNFQNDVNNGLYSSDLKLLEVRPYITVEGVPTTCRTVQTKLEC